MTSPSKKSVFRCRIQVSLFLTLFRFLDNLSHDPGDHNQYLPPYLPRQSFLCLRSHRLRKFTKFQLTHPSYMSYISLILDSCIRLAIFLISSVQPVSSNFRFADLESLGLARSWK